MAIRFCKLWEPLPYIQYVLVCRIHIYRNLTFQTDISEGREGEPDFLEYDCVYGTMLYVVAGSMKYNLFILYTCTMYVYTLSKMKVYVLYVLCQPTIQFITY